MTEERVCRCRNTDGIKVVPHKHIEMPEELREFIVETVFPKLGHNDRKYLGYWFSTTTSVLERYEELQHFIHESVFPKLDMDERNYLAKWFTVIFSDGFESNDFSAWTGTGGAPTVTNAVAHHGTYSMLSDADPEYAYKTFSDENTVYAKIDWYSTDLPSSTAEYDHAITLTDGGTGADNIIALLRLYYSDTPPHYYWRLSHLDGAGLSAVSSGLISLSTGTWYCLELYALVNDGAGAVECWMDEVSQASASGLDNDGRGDIAAVIVGRTFSSGGVTHYTDCVIVADAGPIGCSCVPFAEEEEYHVIRETWFSEPDDVIALTQAASDDVLPNVVLPVLAGRTIDRVYVGFAIGFIENAHAAANGFTAAVDVMIKASAGVWDTDDIPAINLKDNQIMTAGSEKRAGVVFIGDQDVSAEVTAFNDTYNMRIDACTVDNDGLSLYDVQTFLVVIYH